MNTKITMIEGSQKNVIFKFPSQVVNVSLYNFIFEIRSKIQRDLIARFSTEEGTLQKSGNNVILFIPASKTRGINGEFYSQMGFFIEPDDLFKLDANDFIIQKQVLDDDSEPNGDSVYDALLEQEVDITIQGGSVATLQILNFGLFGGGSGGGTGGLSFSTLPPGYSDMNTEIAVYHVREIEDDSAANIIVNDFLGNEFSWIFIADAEINFMRAYESEGGGEAYEVLCNLPKGGVYLVYTTVSNLVISEVLGGGEGGSTTAWTSGTTVPTGGNDGDFYLRTSTYDIYKKTSGTWNIIMNIKGVQGDTGAAGTPGTNGATWSSGSIVPTGGNDGDFYLKTDNYDVYKKASGTWSVLLNIKGVPGVNGATWTSGTSVPTGGNNGDFYLKEDTDDIYKKTSDTWDIITNIKGEQGEPGEPGSGSGGTVLFEPYPVTRQVIGGVKDTIIDYDAIEVYEDYEEYEEPNLLEAVFFDVTFKAKEVPYKVLNPNQIQLLLLTGQSFTGYTTIRCLPTPIGGAITPPETLLSIFDTGGSLLDTDSLTEALEFLASHTFASNTTFQFNTSDEYIIEEKITIDFDNGIYDFIIKSIEGEKAIIDAENALGTLIEIKSSNVKMSQLKLQNADVTNTSGCIVRVDSNTENIELDYIHFKRGYCAVRATGVQDGVGNAVTIIDGLTITNFIVEDTVNGSFRLGNGVTSDPDNLNEDLASRTDSWYDMKNVTIANGELIDNFSKGNITGTSSKFHGLLLLKKILGLSVENVVCNNTAEGLIVIESSSNAVVDGILVDAFGTAGTSNISGISANYTDGFTLINACPTANADGIDKILLYATKTDNIRLYFNTLVANNSGDVPASLFECKNFGHVGNLYKNVNSSPFNLYLRTDFGHTPSMSDVLEDQYNVYCSGGEYNVNGSIKSPGDVVNVELRNNTGGGRYTIATYFAAFGLGNGSLIPTGTDVLLGTRTDPDTTTSKPYYLTAGSVGRNIVPAAQHSILADARGYARTFPSDAGALDRDATVLA